MVSRIAESAHGSAGPRVLIVARVSDPKPGKQDERSVEDQEQMIRQWIGQNLPDSCRIDVFSSSGSGEWIDRGKFLKLTERVHTGRYDIVVTEDLGRILRRLQAHVFAEECVDLGTRLIAINDHVDTNDPGWQDRSIFSAWHHERSNRDTSDRIKRSHRARFVNGGCAAIPIYGYIKPPGSESDADWSKDSAAEPVYREIFERLDRGQGYSEIADWLNATGVTTGPYCTNTSWDGRMVGRLVHNPLLKGSRVRNRRESYRDSRGKYRTRKAPADHRLERDVPHLAFLEEEYCDRVIQKVDRANKRYCRGRNGRDPRENVSRKRTRFPGQMIECGVCGHGYVFGGHGQTDHLMCDGARAYHCWNGATVDGPLAGEKIIGAVLSAIETLPGFDAAFVESVNAEANRHDADDEKRRNDLQRQIQKLNRELNNLVRFVRDGRASRRIEAEIARLEEELDEREGLLAELNAKPRSTIKVPSVDKLRSLARAKIANVVSDGYELKRVMQALIPKIVVFPCQLCDGGKVELRASFRLQAAGLLIDERARAALQRPLEQVLHVDLFEPPQRAAFREQVVRLRQGNDCVRRMTQREVARELGLTVTAVQRAAALQRMMDRRGLDNPYLRLTEPTEECGKLRRHRHPRYRFQPLEHAGQL